MKLITNHQYLTTEKINDNFGKKDFSSLSIGQLIEHQNLISSTIGLYLFSSENREFCLLLSNDKNLAKKLSITPSPDFFTQDLFPVDYNQISLKNILIQDNDEVTFIKNNNGNYYYMIAKDTDAENTLKFIDIYKKKSYAMQNYWAKRKAI